MASRNKNSSLKKLGFLLSLGVSFLSILTAWIEFYENISFDTARLRHHQSQADRSKGEVSVTIVKEKSQLKSKLLFKNELKAAKVWNSGKCIETVYDVSEVPLPDTLLSGDVAVVLFTTYTPYDSESFDVEFKGFDTKPVSLKNQENRNRLIRVILIIIAFISGIFGLKRYTRLDAVNQRLYKRIKSERSKRIQMADKNGLPLLSEFIAFCDSLLKEFDNEG